MEWVVVAGLAGVLLASPIFFGSVSIWARGVFFVASAFLLAVWLARGAWTGQLYLARTGLWVLGLACVGLAIFQMIPLEQATLKWLSPGTAEIYEQTLGYQGEIGKQSLSVSSAASRSELYRWGIIIMVFVVAVNTVRTRNRLLAVVLVLLGLGCFQALYGFLDQFRGKITQLSGTFHSKNQFAALLAMIVPLSLAMVAGVGKSNGGSGSGRYRTAQWLGSRTFAQQILLGAMGVLMGLAVLFSASRAGLFTMLAGITVFGCYLLSKSSLRRYSVAVFAIIVIFVVLGASIGMSGVMERVKDVTSLQAISWQGRLDLVRSGRQMVGDFSLWGTGLGTLPLAVGRYQSLIEGNWTVFSLHNDWLQAACDNGLIGAGLIVAMVAIFVTGVLRRLRHSREQLCKLLSIAALVGAGTMGLHSFADRNLSKVTANGIVFAVLLALAYAGAHLATVHGNAATKKPGYWRLRLGPWPIRVILAIIAVVGLGWLCVEPIKAGLADINFNRYLAASPAYPKVCQSYPRSRQLKRDDYFWLKHSGPTDDQDWAGERLRQARELAPDNHRYLRAEAMSLVEGIDRVVDEQAQLRTKILFGEEVEQTNELQYKQAVWAMAAMVRGKVYRQAEYKQQLRQACGLLAEAIRLAPSKPGYHLDLAIVLARLDKVYNEPADNPIDSRVRPMETAQREIKIALWLAPHKPAMLFGAGCVALDQALSTAEKRERELLLNKALLRFRRAMFGGPDPKFMYPQRVYQLLEMGQVSDLMLKATPQTVPATTELAQHLLEAGRWKQALRVLEILEKIAALPAKPVSLAYFRSGLKEADSEGDMAWQRRAGMPSAYSPRSQPKDFSERTLRIALMGKCQALGRLGRWKQRQEQVSRCWQMARETSEASLEQADRQADKRFYRSAMAQYLSVLQKDWANARALIGAAEIVDVPGMPSNQRQWNSLIELLYRLVMHNRELTSEQYQQVRGILSRLYPKKSAEQVELDFIRGALSCLVGDYERAVEGLSALVKTDEPRGRNWEQEHLIWYFLGLANEGLGQKEDAIAGYKRAVEIVPSHGPSLVALQRLEDEEAGTLLAEFRPANECNISFGGKVRLLGYTLRRTEKGWQISYFWQFKDRLMTEAWMDIGFCDGRGRVIFADRHKIEHSGAAYWLPTARWGEIVIEERVLKGDPRSCEGIRLAFWSAQQLAGRSRYLLNQLGQESTFVRCVTQTKSNFGPKAQESKVDERQLGGASITN